MEADENSGIFTPIELQKGLRTSHWDKPNKFIAYKVNVNLCPVTTLIGYLHHKTIFAIR